MTTMTRSFELDKEVLQDVDKIMPVEMQSKYINDYFAKMIAERKQNQAEIEDIIWNFATYSPPSKELTGVEIIRQLRDGDSRE